MATTPTRVYTLDADDELVRTCPSPHFDNYIDDNVISAEGGPEAVARDIGAAAQKLSELVTEELACRISRRKTKVLASNATLGGRIKAAAERAIGGALAPATLTVASTTQRVRPGGRMAGTTRALSACALVSRDGKGSLGWRTPSGPPPSTRSSRDHWPKRLTAPKCTV